MDRLLISFLMSFPLFMDVILIALQHRCKYIRKRLLHIIPPDHIDRCPLLDRSYKKARSLTGKVEEFNVNFFLIISLFLIGLVNSISTIRYSFLITSFVLVIVLMQLKPVICDNHEKFKYSFLKKRPILAYAIAIWVLVMMINYGVLLINEHYGVASNIV